MGQLMNDFQERLYLIFAAIFIASLVACNLIFQKFFNIDFFGYPFIQSVGLIAYPITFIVTDLISELYGKKRANQVVIAGFCASIFTTLLIFVSINVPAWKPEVIWSPLVDNPWIEVIVKPKTGSPVSQSTFEQVFGLAGPAFFASMVAYLTAQFLDVRIFHFWKRLTKGKYLWLRNNASTMFSQLVDTSLVLLILCSYEVLLWKDFTTFLINGWLFKVIVALIDTPIIYFILWTLKDKIKPVSYLEE